MWARRYAVHVRPIEGKAMNIRSSDLPSRAIPENGPNFRYGIKPEVLAVGAAEDLLDEVVHGVIHSIPRLLKNRVQDHEAACGLEHAMGLTHDLNRSAAKVVKSEGSEGAVEDAGCKRESLREPDNLKIAAEQWLFHFFPAHAEHRRRTINAKDGAALKLRGHRPRKPARTGGDVEDGLAPVELKKV
jgi:hypothetical protein